VRNRVFVNLIFLKNYVTSTFVDTVSWWLQQRNQVDEDTISHYFNFLKSCPADDFFSAIMSAQSWERDSALARFSSG